MQTAMFHKILDQFAGVLLAAILLVVIGIFVVGVQPWKAAPTPADSSHSTPTPGAVSTINGTVVFDCQNHPCTNDYSAFDVAAYASNQTTPTAQTPIGPNGHFSLHLPAGGYTIKTIPQSATQIAVSTNPDKPTAITLHIKVASKAP